MAGVKTAISLDEKLFNRVNEVATEMRVSRSHLFSLAVSEYLKKRENRDMLAQLNKVYEAPVSDEEEKVSAHMRSKHKKVVEREPW